MGTIGKMIDKKGFTLIEMVVAIGVVALIIPVVFGVFYNLIFAQTKLFHLTQVKREGDFVLSFIKGTIQNNAQEIHNLNPCSNWSGLSSVNAACNITGSTFNSVSSGADFCFVDKSGNGFNFYLSNSGGSPITYAAQGASSNDLTSSKVVVSNFSISCARSATYAPALVTVNFNIGYSGVGIGITRPEDIATMLYQTTFQMKNY